MVKLFIQFVLISTVISCQNGNKTAPKTQTAISESIPPLPESELRALAFNCTSIEYTFKTLPITLSVSQNEGLETNIFFASMEAIDYDASACQSIARKIFNVGTEIYMEAEVYFSPGCRHYDFYKNGKLTYRTKITDQGLNFYKSIILQAAGGQQQQ